MSSERKNIIQPVDWWAAWTDAAQADGQDLSAWIGERVNKSLPPKIQKKLSPRPSRGRVKKHPRDDHPNNGT